MVMPVLRAMTIFATRARTFSTKHAVLSAEPDPRGERLVVRVAESTDVYFYDVTTHLTARYEGQELAGIVRRRAYVRLDQILVGDTKGRLRITTLLSGMRNAFCAPRSAVYGADFSPDSHSIVTDGSDRIVRRVNRRR